MILSFQGESLFYSVRCGVLMEMMESIVLMNIHVITRHCHEVLCQGIWEGTVTNLIIIGVSKAQRFSFIILGFLRVLLHVEIYVVLAAP